MNNLLEEKIDWADREHKDGLHDTYQENCYDCHRENKQVKASLFMGALQNPYGSNYPLGYIPE